MRCFVKDFKKLKKFGFEKATYSMIKHTDKYGVDDEEIILYIATKKESVGTVGEIAFNSIEHDRKYKVADYIQDIIDAGLVEVRE